MGAGDRQTETGEARAGRPGSRRHRQGARDPEMAAGQYSNICIRIMHRLMSESLTNGLKHEAVIMNEQPTLAYIGA